MNNMELQSVVSLYNLALNSVSKTVKTVAGINNLLIPKQLKKDLYDQYIIPTRVVTLVDQHNRTHRKANIKFANIDIFSLIQLQFKVSPDLLTYKDYNKLNNLLELLLTSEDYALINLAMLLLKNNKTNANIKRFLQCCQSLFKLDAKDIIANLQRLFVNDSKIEKRIIGYLICCELYTKYQHPFKNEVIKNKLLDVINYFLKNSNRKLTIGTASALLYCLEENHEITQTAKTKILQSYQAQLHNKIVSLVKLNSREDYLQQLPQTVIKKLTTVELSLNKQIKPNLVIMSGLSNQFIANMDDIAIYYQNNSNQLFDLTTIANILTSIKNKTNHYLGWIKKYQGIRKTILMQDYKCTEAKIKYDFKQVIYFVWDNRAMCSTDIIPKLQEAVDTKGLNNIEAIDKITQIVENNDFIEQALESFISLDATIVNNTKELNLKFQELNIVFDNHYLVDENITVDQLLNIHGFTKITTDALNSYFWNNIFLQAHNIKYCLLKKYYGKSGVCILENYNDIKDLISYKTKIEQAVMELESDKEIQLEKDIISTILDPNAVVITRIELKQAFDDFINCIIEIEDTNVNFLSQTS
jgi:hypothetical protein